MLRWHLFSIILGRHCGICENLNRVLFDVQTVVVNAISRKTHNRLLIDGEEVEP